MLNNIFTNISYYYYYYTECSIS